MRKETEHNPALVFESQLPENHRFLSREESEFLQKLACNPPPLLSYPELLIWNGRDWNKNRTGYIGDSGISTYCVPQDFKIPGMKYPRQARTIS